MRQKILFGYAIVAIVLFIGMVIAGKVFKKGLGNGVELGFFNSFILSSLWPISAIVTISGFCYEVVQTWKRL